MCYQCSSGASYSSGSSATYSNLENIASSYNPISSSYSNSSSDYSANNISYMITDSGRSSPLSFYETSSSGSDIYKAAKYQVRKSITLTYSNMPDDFLNLNRPNPIFIGSASEIKELVEEAFMLTTGKPFPNDIQIAVVSEDQLKSIHSKLSGRWNSGIQGFAINRKKQGLLSEIFVKKGELDKIMLTLGHEIGHVLTKQKENRIDEEAKAFAFSLAWMKAIKDNNIANLSTAIRLDKPAENGLHNIALDFVLRLIQKGQEAIDIYLDLVKGLIEVNQNAWNI